MTEYPAETTLPAKTTDDKKPRSNAEPVARETENAAADPDSPEVEHKAADPKPAIEKEYSKVKLSEIDINGLWGKTGFKVSFEDKIRVLVGENGSGKSHILQLVAQALEQNDVLDFEKEVKSIKLVFKDKSVIHYRNGKIVKSRDEVVNPIYISTLDFDVQNIDDISNPDAVRASRWMGKQLNLQLDTSIGDFFSKSEETVTQNLALLKSRLDSFFLNDVSDIIKKSVEFCPPMRLTKDSRNLLLQRLAIIGKKSLADRVSEFDLLDPDSNRFIMNTTFLDFLDDLLIEPGVIDRLLPDLLGTMETIEEEPLTSIVFRLSSNDNNVLLPYWLLSTGERQLLYMMLKTIDNIDQSKLNILILDEPEISLHLDWQARLLETLESLDENLQILIATHSPGVILKKYIHTANKIDTIRK